MMLAKGGEGIGQVLIFLVIVAVFIIRGIVEYFRRQKAEEEARRKRLDQGTEGEPEPDSETKARPAGGLEALLEALAEGEEPTRSREPERPEPRPAGPRGEVWDARKQTIEDGGTLLEPSTLRLESTRDTEAEFGRHGRRDVDEGEAAVNPFEAYQAEREAETRRQQERARELREEAARARKPRTSRPSVPELGGGPVPEAAAGIAPAFAGLAPEGKRPSVADARKGILWSVVLGRPRALSSYGERGASEAPGGIL